MYNILKKKNNKKNKSKILQLEIENNNTPAINTKKKCVCVRVCI